MQKVTSITTWLKKINKVVVSTSLTDSKISISTAYSNLPWNNTVSITIYVHDTSEHPRPMEMFTIASWHDQNQNCEVFKNFVDTVNSYIA